MTTTSGNLVIIGLNTKEPQYFWKGTQLKGVVKMYLKKGTKITLKVLDITVIPVDMFSSGIKIKEVR